MSSNLLKACDDATYNAERIKCAFTNIKPNESEKKDQCRFCYTWFLVYIQLFATEIQNKRGPRSR